MADTSSGTRFYISAALPATVNEAGFEALTFTEIGDVDSLGEKGGEANLVSRTPLATGVVAKYKGSTNYGAASVTGAYVKADAGQVILKAAGDAAEKDSYSFKEVAPDGTIEFYTGKVMGFKVSTGGADDIKGFSATIEVDSKIIDATA